MYKKKSEPVKSLLDFSLFVTFFPHFVARPIVRPPQLVPQFESPSTANKKQLMQGLFLITLGMFMKVVLADSMLAEPANTVFNSKEALNGLDARMDVLAFSGQIFFDFAGYSTCAIGVAACLGFVLPENFLYPYAATGFSDFWRRWHITLSAWLRDYLYISLRGNRHGTFKTYINLMITMLLGGLWHGASRPFVVWGALHGFYLMVEKFIQAVKPKLQLHSSILNAAPLALRGIRAPRFLKTLPSSNFIYALFTFFLVNVTWVFFRAPDFTSAWRMLAAMFGAAHNDAVLLSNLCILKITVIIICMPGTHGYMRNRRVLGVADKIPLLGA